MKLIIDCREKVEPDNIVSLLSNINSNNKITVEKKELSIGDFIFTTDDDILLLLIERKTWSDLIASIKDGRYHEQKARIEKYITNSARKMYLLEGKRPLNDTKRLDSVIINTSVRDKYIIHYTNDLEHTISWIVEIAIRIYDYQNIIINNSNDNTINQIAQTVSSKKNNLTVDKCFYNQLIQIPNISDKLAQYIQTKWSNYTQMLLNLLKLNKNEQIELFANFKTNKAILGKKKAEVIIEYLINGYDISNKHNGNDLNNNDLNNNDLNNNDLNNND